jgi:hypothetical protein
VLVTTHRKEALETLLANAERFLQSHEQGNRSAYYMGQYRADIERYKAGLAAFGPGVDAVRIADYSDGTIVATPVECSRGYARLTG